MKREMKQIKHHLTDELLMGYSAGTLPEAFSLVVATHISMCDECRARLAEYDAVGGQVIMSGDPAMLAEDSLQATLDLIANSDPTEEVPARSPVRDAVFPAPLQDYVAGDIDAVKWRRIGGGVSQMILSTSESASVRLLKIPGGTAMPDHGHHGTELTLVLQGAFSDEDDRFDAGDVEVANEDVSHTPIAVPGQDCICLAATDGPLRFRGIIPRVAQRFINI